MLHFHKVAQNESGKCGTGLGGGWVKPQKGRAGGGSWGGRGGVEAGCWEMVESKAGGAAGSIAAVWVAGVVSQLQKELWGCSQRKADGGLFQDKEQADCSQGFIRNGQERRKVMTKAEAQKWKGGGPGHREDEPGEPGSRDGTR